MLRLSAKKQTNVPTMEKEREKERNLFLVHRRFYTHQIADVPMLIIYK